MKIGFHLYVKMIDGWWHEPKEYTYPTYEECIDYALHNGYYPIDSISIWLCENDDGAITMLYCLKEATECFEEYW